MEKINGICIDGKFYEAVKYDGMSPCIHCALARECDRFDEDHHTTQFCIDYLMGCIFRHSPELTRRLNNSKTKEQ